MSALFTVATMSVKQRLAQEPSLPGYPIEDIRSLNCPQVAWRSGIDLATTLSKAGPLPENWAISLTSFARPVCRTGDENV
jgi:hypothetical protein